VHEVVGPAFLVWLELSELAQAMRQWLWLYPIVEIAHITGIVLLVGSVAMLDLRLLGLSRTLPVSQMARHLLPWSMIGLGIAAVTGVMMFAAHATEFVANPAFLLKLTLIGVAGLNALLFHRRIYPTVTQWDTGNHAPTRAKISAVASLILWLGVISCGRLLAYL
jgi:hypothetical protein